MRLSMSNYVNGLAGHQLEGHLTPIVPKLYSDPRYQSSGFIDVLDMEYLIWLVGLPMRIVL